MAAGDPRIFTNPDQRLRPQAELSVDASRPGPSEYAVTDANFPELNREFQRIQREAGLSGYRLLILGNDFGGAGSDWDRKVVGVGIRMINAMTFEDIRGILGHEFGHMYRHAHPNMPFVGAPTPGLTAGREAEVEADRLGACLVGDVAVVAGMLRNGGVALDPGLTNELRVQEVLSFPLSACPVGKSRSRPRD